MKFEIKPQEVAEYNQNWFDFKDGAKFLIADADKPSFNRALELNGMQADRELLGLREITDESALASQLAFNRAVSHLITGWQGVEDSEGKQLEYSPKNAELLCSSSNESLALVVFCLNKAKQLQTDKHKTVEDEVGKSSSTTSNETSSGNTKRRKKSIKSSA